MGLLDEAIREHLELKRRRGGDPTEIEELEQEALGPVRPVAPESPGDMAEYPETAGPLADEAARDEIGHEAEFEEDEADWVEEDEFQDEFQEPERPHAELGEPAGEEFTDTASTHGVVPPPEPAHEDEPAPSPGPPPGSPAHDVGVETAEYDVEAEHAAEEGEGEGESDDMLEETPEFLQDTPDHDRLWFEQRPPKDFDFEG